MSRPRVRPPNAVPFAGRTGGYAVISRATSAPVTDRRGSRGVSARQRQRARKRCPPKGRSTRCGISPGETAYGSQGRGRTADLPPFSSPAVSPRRFHWLMRQVTCDVRKSSSPPGCAELRPHCGPSPPAHLTSGVAVFEPCCIPLSWWPSVRQWPRCRLFRPSVVDGSGVSAGSVEGVSCGGCDVLGELVVAITGVHGSGWFEHQD
jgi:hypothetical protein